VRHTPPPTPPSAPRSFWDPIEAARGDHGAFRAALQALTRDQLTDMYRTWCRLEREIHVWPEDPARQNEGEIWDAAAWAVQQGEAMYRFVWQDPEARLPIPNEVGRSLVEDILDVYRERFGEELLPEA
jgi:hypothetical protein